MERPAGEWTNLNGSLISYRKDENSLELSCTSGAFIGVMITLVVTFLLGFVFLAYPTSPPVSWLGPLLYALVFLIGPCFAFPWLPFKNHLIVDKKKNTLEIVKKNVGKKILTCKSYSLDDVEDIKIDVLAGESTAYRLSLNIKHVGTIRLWSNSDLGNVRNVEELLRSRIPRLKTRATEYSVSGLAIPLQAKHEVPAKTITSTPANRDSVLTCAVDHSAIEGFVYACPRCHALLCNACMSVYAARSLGCPRCGHPVPPARQRDESPLLEMADEMDENRESS